MKKLKKNGFEIYIYTRLYRELYMKKCHKIYTHKISVFAAIKCQNYMKQNC